MRIILVPNVGGPVPPKKGGAIRLYVYQLARHLRSLGIDATVVTSKWSSEEPYEEELNMARIVRINAPKIPMNLPWRFPAAAHMLEEYLFGVPLTRLLNERDIIHANTICAGYYIANTKFVRRMIYTCHNSTWTINNPDLVERYVNITLEKSIMKKVKAIIAVSPTLRENILLKAQLPEDKVFYIPNGVDTEFFRPDIPCGDVKRKYNLEGHKVLLFVGRITPIKGVDVLVRALHFLVNKYKMKNVKCVMVGPLTGPKTSTYAKQIVSMVKTLGLSNNVVFAGRVSDDALRKLYAASDVFVIPSWGEAMPMVVLEAMAAGKPVVGGKVGGISDLVNEGINGYCFSPGDYAALAQILATLLSDEPLLKKMGLEGRTIAEQMHNWQTVARKVAALYTDIFGPE